ncbi:hypothetical protein ACTL6U_08510 [Rhodovibrionaceae bacterium A322]
MSFPPSAFPSCSTKRFPALPLLVACLFLVLTLAACGQLPQPYQPDGKEDLNLRLLAESSMVIIDPMSGDVPGQSDLLETKLEEALVGEGLLVRNGSGGSESSKGLHLRSTAQLLPLSVQETVLRIDWLVVDEAGETAARNQQELVIPQDLWLHGDATLFKAVAQQAAIPLANQLLGPPLQEVKFPGFPGARLVMAGVTGAPGDGDESLDNAFKRVLANTDLPIASIPQPGDLLVNCDVSLGEPKDDQQLLTLTWRVTYLDPALPGLEADKGEVLGEISQANPIPVGALNGRWGGLAHQISRAAFQGVQDLLFQAGQQREDG